MAFPLQLPMVRDMLTFFIFLLSCYNVSADLVIPNNLDIERYLTPRLFSPREETIPGDNFTFPLQERSLFQRQDSECNPGYVYCPSNGRCCYALYGCCEASCKRPGGKCCDNGISCPAGYGCCDALNIGNNDCAPLNSMCCLGGHFCRPGWACCTDTCAPMNGACCRGIGYCAQGNKCVIYNGLQRCCPGGICTGRNNNAAGRTTITSRPGILGDNAEIPIATEEVKAIALGSIPTSVQANSNEPAPTEEGSALTNPADELFALPSITSPTSSELSFSSTNISFTTTSSIVSEGTSPIATTTTQKSMGTSRIPRASWWAVVLGIAVAVGVVPELETVVGVW